MTQSILESVKGTLGILPDQTSFDSELLLHINSAIGTLTQLGVGPEAGYTVESVQEVWTDFLGTDHQLNPVKSYVHLRVKLLFDPPDIGFVLTAMKDQIKELEWRLNVLVDDQPLPPQPTLLVTSDGGV